ncbi:MAG: hypothetical protein QOJ19_3904, partial [Acidimicrobiia bacterium]|nr:hypothetical protein [Acidimicrobiia bacterium]
MAASTENTGAGRSAVPPAPALAGAVIDLARGEAEELPLLDQIAGQPPSGPPSGQPPPGTTIPGGTTTDATGPSNGAPAGADRKADNETRRTTVRVGVLHATLETASYPLLMGQTRGSPISGAVGYLDGLYDGDISRRQFSDVLPEHLNEFAIIQPPVPGERPEVVGLMGLGPPGELSPPVLTRAVSRAIRQLALGRLLPAVEGGWAVSTLLVGTAGPEAMSIRESVRSLVDGIIDANRTLRALGAHMGEVVGLEVVELFADRAEIADTELCRFCQSLEREMDEAAPAGAEAAQVQCQLPRVGEGGRPGQTPTEYREGAWRRIVIRTPDATNQDGQVPALKLEYLTMSRRAAADLGVQVVDSRKLAVIEQLTTVSVTDSQLPNTLYELLIPVDLKRDLADGTHLQLVLTEDTAGLPWEMLATAPQTDMGVSTRRKPLPLATQFGLLRQLELPDELRRRVPRAKGSDVFVLGNPPAGPTFPTLPGAANEADAVRALFDATAGGDPERSFITRGVVFDENGQARWDTIGDPELPLTVRLLDALMAHSYRVLHLAGHGAVDPVSNLAGVVVGAADFLTATELANLPYVPDLVFLNCCHLGHIDRGMTPNRLAANLAVSLMGIGVRAVVAAGWAVNDNAAQQFALTFYEQLIQGVDLGSAALLARRSIGESALYGNTYGAYQVYGDPSFRLTPRVETSGDAPPARTRSGLERALRTARVSLAAMPGDSTRQPAKRRMIEELRAQIEQRQQQGERNTGALWAELGGCYGELAVLDEAISCYRTALADGQGDAQFRDAEQLANLLSRMVEGDPGSLEAAGKEADRMLHLLLDLAPTAERHGLVGGHRRRRALRAQPLDLHLLAGALSDDAYGAVTRPSFDTSGYLAVNYVALTALLALALPDIAGSLPQARAVRQRFAASDPHAQPRPADVFDRLLPTEMALADALLSYAEAKLPSAVVDNQAAAAVAADALRTALSEVAVGYRTQFGQRSTPRQQASAVEAVEEWATVAQACGDPGLARALRELAQGLGLRAS